MPTNKEQKIRVLSFNELNALRPAVWQGKLVLTDEKGHIYGQDDANVFIAWALIRLAVNGLPV